MRGVLRSLAVAAAGTGLVVGAAHLASPMFLAQRTVQGPAVAASARLVTQTQAICPGSEALGVVGLKDSRAQITSVTAVAAPAEALPSGLDAAQTAGSLTIGGLPSGGTWAAPGTVRGRTISGQISSAQSALVAGTGAMAPGTVATQRSRVTTGDDRGLVTSACMPAAVSSWLIAGGPQPGRRERLVLTNPGPNAVTVDVVVLGAKGPVQSPNGHGLVVGPHSRTVMLLNVISGSEPSPVVHVSVQGGEVAAVLNDTWLDGVVPRGGDDAVPVAAPAREQVIAGVAIQGRATLRIAVPGDNEGIVESRVLTLSGPKALPANGVTRVAAHSTRDIDLSALPPDAYAVQVRADVPVVAAALVDRRLVPSATSDLAWAAASVPITTLAGMALPGPDAPGTFARLDLAATYKPASVLVTTVDVDGQVITKGVDIGADSVSSLTLDGASSVWVTPRSGVVRAAVLTGFKDATGVLLSVTPLTDLTLTSMSTRLRALGD